MPPSPTHPSPTPANLPTHKLCAPPPRKNTHQVHASLQRSPHASHSAAKLCPARQAIKLDLTADTGHLLCVRASPAAAAAAASTPSAAAAAASSAAAADQPSAAAAATAAQRGNPAAAAAAAADAAAAAAANQAA